MTAIDPWHKRLTRRGISETASQIFWMLAGSLWLWAGGPAAISLALGHWTETPIDIKFGLAFSWFALGALLWAHRNSFSTRLGAGANVAKASTRQPDPFVEFSIPSNWGDGFFFAKKEPDPRVGEFMAEELRLRVVAKRAMKDVRFELTLKRRDRGTNQLETLAQIGSSKFAGTVPKGVEQTFVLMRRRFWHTMAWFDNPLTQEKGHQQIRVGDDITMMPENPAPFEGQVNERYFVEISIAHDDVAPEAASFAISLTENPLGFPRSSVTVRRNIEVVRP